MKILQTKLLKIPFTLLLFWSIAASHAQSQKIGQADSLFRVKQYTQSMALYQSVFKEKKYSASMLLKMAFIQEGLGNIGQTLYYLKLYYLASDDEQALQKMDELATKFKLSGYSFNQSNQLNRWINKNILLLQLTLSGIILTAFGLFFMKRKNNKVSWSMPATIFIGAAALIYSTNYYTVHSVIVGNDRTYLMEGPSAGANVAAVIGEGNQLEMEGQQDVWLEVKWVDKIVYVKKSAVLIVAL